MRPRLLMVFFALLGLTATAAAQDRRSLVVANVGNTTITVGDYEDRIGRGGIQPFQLRAFGDRPEIARKHFLDEVVIPDALLALGAEARNLAREPATADRLERNLAEATMRAVRAGVGPASAISMDDVKKYYEEQRDHFDAPERYLVWRILCATRDEADQVLADLKQNLTQEKFYELARQHSLDKTTSLRGGNLGYVGPDGVSKEPGLSVDPEIPRAAARIHDGELVLEPVAEKDHFAVIWRRSSLGASHRSVEDAAGQIRDTLWKRRVETAQKALLDRLRAEKVKDVDMGPLQGLEVPSFDGGITPRGRPGQVSPRK